MMQAHKKAKIWKTKRFPLFDSIQILVDSIVATGENTFHAGTATQLPPATQVMHSVFERDGSFSSDEDGGKSDEAYMYKILVSDPILMPFSGQ
jgi:hypothetical protein